MLTNKISNNIFVQVFKISTIGTSLVVRWLRLYAPNAGDPGSIPGQGTRTHMPQLSVLMPQLKDPARSNEDSACRN